MKKLIMFSALFLFGIVFMNSQSSNAGSDIFNYKNSDSVQTCIVSGEEIQAGGGVKYKYLNREVSFCCEGCVKSFKKEPASFIKEGLHCPVCSEDDASKEISHSHDGVKYYFCGNGCKKKFENDTQKYLDNYNKNE